MPAALAVPHMHAAIPLVALRQAEHATALCSEPLHLKWFQ